MPTDAKKWLQEQIDNGSIPDNDGAFHWGVALSEEIRREREDRKDGTN